MSMTGGPALRILAYHRIAACDGDALRDRPELTVTPADFEFQMRLVAKRYTPVSLDDVLQAKASGRLLPGRAVLITFDDAYSSVADAAWPILRELGLPATVFVPTAYPSLEEHGFWWDRLRSTISETDKRQLALDGFEPLGLESRAQRLNAYKILRGAIKDSRPQRAGEILQAVADQLGRASIEKEIMSWEQMRALAAEGLNFAPHSHSHPILTRLDARELEAELVEPMEILRQRLGACPAAIAYPSGQFDERVVEAAKSVGYELGFTTEMRHDRLRPDNCLTLGRVCLTAKFSRLAFRVALSRGGPQIAAGYRRLRGIARP